MKSDGERVTTFTGVRQDGNSRETPSIRYEVNPGCYVTIFDDGRTRFTMNPKEAGRKVHHRINNTSNLPGGS